MTQRTAKTVTLYTMVTTSIPVMKCKRVFLSAG